MKLDDIDEKIISILKNNARTANVEIAKAVGLTEGAVRHRIEVLLTKGTVTRFTVETTGAGVYGVVMLKARGETKKMMAEIQTSGLMKEGYEVSGAYDGCAIIEGSSLEEVDAKIDKLRKLKNVKGTETFICLKRW